MAVKQALAFQHVSASDSGVKALFERIDSTLKAKQRVLWLVSGGSNIPITIEVMELLDDEDLDYLAIALIDERNVPADHPDSNMHQLLKAGFEPRGVSVLSVLSAESVLPLQATNKQLPLLLNYMFEKAQLVVAQLGIGEDGHIAGILPHSPAIRSRSPIVSYKSSPFNRTTMSFATLKRIDVAYVFAFGKNKRSAVRSLRDQRLSLDAQPAQILKQLPEVHIYSDQIGDIA